MRLSRFSVLSFDCYGTLVDWETGICTALKPLLTVAGREVDRNAALELFGKYESEQQARTPGMRYTDLLAVVHRQLAAHWGLSTSEEADAVFAGSVASWPAFSDSESALQYLRQYYKLAILSNCDHESFAGTLAHLRVEFDHIYLAEDVGSYKPDPGNFAYMLTKLAREGVGRGDILHVAQSLFHDHAPANHIGLASAWIDRREGQSGWGATPPSPGTATYDFRFPSLQHLVTAHSRELAQLGSQ